MDIDINFDVEPDIDNNTEKDIYCIGISNIKVDNIDLISCKKIESLTNCHKCIDLSFKVKRAIPRICIVELYDICEQKVKKLDNCNNRCPDNCFFANNGVCRKFSGGNNIPCNQS